jgi:hypothetical protein
MAMRNDVAELFAAHGGCASVSSLVQLEGISHDTVLRMRAQGLVRPVHWGVVQLVGAPTTGGTRLWAALLRCGDHAVAGAMASCWLHGLEGFSRLTVDVVLAAPHRSRGTSFPARTRTLDRIDKTRVRGFPALTAARAIIEVAPSLKPKELRVLIDSARRKGLVSIAQLRARALALEHEAGSRRGALAVLEAIGSGTFEQESENERACVDFLATTQLKLEWQVADLVPGRRFDAVDRAAQLIIEIDSRLWHTLGSDRDSDGLRDLEVGEVVDGYKVFRLTLGMVRYHAEETRRRIDAIRAKRLAATEQRAG